MRENILKEICYTLAKSHEEGATEQLQTMIKENVNIIENKTEFYSKIIEMIGYIRLDDNKKDITNESIKKLSYIVSLMSSIENVDSTVNNWIKFNKKETNTTIIYLGNNENTKSKIQSFLSNNYIKYINNDEIMKFIFKMDNLDSNEILENLLNEIDSTKEKINAIKDELETVGYDDGWPISSWVEPKEKKDLRKKFDALCNTIVNLIDVSSEKLKFDNKLLYKIIEKFEKFEYKKRLSEVIINNHVLEKDSINKHEFYVKILRMRYEFEIYSSKDKLLTLEDLIQIDKIYNKDYYENMKYPNLMFNYPKKDKNIYKIIEKLNKEHKREIFDNFIKFEDEENKKQEENFQKIRRLQRERMADRKYERRHGIHKFGF